MEKRKIKFRAWNGEQIIFPDYVDRKGIAWWKENSIPTYSDKVMQFTGVLDNKGVEIYEGDVVKGIMAKGAGIATRSGKECLFIVVFSESVKGWFLRQITKLKGDFRGYPRFRETEVVGNIHQNPELIK